jgi:glycosyltransferase involved in cell wall biosynthesis
MMLSDSLFLRRTRRVSTQCIAFTPAARHIVVGVTHPQTCVVQTGRLRALREAGFRVTLVCSPGELLDKAASSEDVEAIALPIARCIAPIADLVSLVRICRLLRRLRPDATEFSTPKAGLLGTVASWICGVPLRVYLLRGLKLETASGLKRKVLLAAEQVAAACAHIVLCNSESLLGEAAELGVAPRSKLHMLGRGSSNGVDTRRFSPGVSNVRERLGIPAGAPVVGFVGRLTRDKGLPELVEAFEEILKVQPEAYLLLVGWFDVAEDAIGEELRRVIDWHPRIHCTGFVEDTPAYYRAMDVMVLPSWREGFPNAALEAAASGIPVVCTFSTGARDAVIPEVTGLLIPPGYPEAITEAVDRLLGDPELRARMGAAGRTWVLENYNCEYVHGQLARFYKSMLRREPRRRR